MFSSGASCRHVYDEFANLAKDVEGGNDNENRDNESRTPSCPRVLVGFFAFPVPALIDTGSQITAISEEFYKYLQLHGELTEMPVSNVMLYTAIGRKPTAIKKQIFYNLIIGDKKYPTCFLVVPRLSDRKSVV